MYDDDDDDGSDDDGGEDDDNEDDSALLIMVRTHTNCIKENTVFGGQFNLKDRHDNESLCLSLSLS